jgi:hypothetical protein
VRTVPGVRKAVKWNTPFYGIEGQGWFLGFHCLTKYVKVAFFRGTSLRPVPPGESKSKDTRYLNIDEDDQLNEAQLAAWVKQASQCPANDCEANEWRSRRTLVFVARLLPTPNLRIRLVHRLPGSCKTRSPSGDGRFPTSTTGETVGGQ